MTDNDRRGRETPGRSPHSENRQRTKLVAVRFSPAEYTILAAAAAREGKGESTLLRETFLRSATEGDETDD